MQLDKFVETFNDEEKGVAFDVLEKVIDLLFQREFDISAKYQFDFRLSGLQEAYDVVNSLKKRFE